MIKQIKQELDERILGDMNIMKMIHEWCEEKGSPYFQRRDLIRVCGISEERADRVLHDAVTTWAVHQKGSSWYSIVSVREKVEGYLANKWGIPLAPEHPYSDKKMPAPTLGNEVKASSDQVVEVYKNQVLVEAIVL